MKRTRNNSTVSRYSLVWFPVCSSLLLLFGALAWTGCKREPQATTAASDPAGTYTLVSIDGKPVPCTISHEGASPTIKSGTFIINSDGTCTSTMLFSVPPGGDSTREVHATFTREGSTLTMRWQGAGITTGTVQGNTFTMNNEGMALAYRR